MQRWLKHHPSTPALHADQFQLAHAGGACLRRPEEKQLRCGVFTSVTSLEAAALKCLDERNADAKPFAWTTDTNTILGRAAKNRAVISKSAQGVVQKSVQTANCWELNPRQKQ